jgi:hypothetical protein
VMIVVVSFSFKSSATKSTGFPECLPTFSRLAYPGPLPIVYRHCSATPVAVKAPDIFNPQSE